MGVRLNNIAKSFGSFAAIRDVSMEIPTGSFAVFVGPSGCGKSTLLRMIAGLEETSGGRIAIDDRDVTAVEPADRGVAMVFQNYALYPHLTVFENMAFSLRLARRPKAEVTERVGEAARILQLEEHLHKRPSQLSGGQRQRVAIAAAIAASPSILIADEATSALDTVSQAAIATLLDDLVRQENKTLVFITHDIGLASSLADEIAVLRAGLLVEHGPTRRVLSTPAHDYTRALLADYLDLSTPPLISEAAS